MSAKKLIDLAKSKGYAVGRNRPGVYRYAFVESGGVVENSFEGGWSDFVRFVKGLPSRA